MNKVNQSIFLAFLLFTFVGCSTVIKGTDQVISISSEPSQARVFIDGQPQGNTPISVSLKKNKYSTIRIEKQGYAVQTRAMGKSYDPISVLNVFWDFSTTDLITGAAFEYQPNNFHFILEQAEVKKSSAQ